MRDAPPAASMAPSTYPGELLIWLSPSFPVGSFAYSQGLETAVEQEWVSDQSTLATWLSAVLKHGALYNDLIIMSLALRATSTAELRDIATLSAALQPSAERTNEAHDQGRSFVTAYLAGWVRGTNNPFAEISDITLPIAVSIAARHHVIGSAATLEAYAIAFCNNLVSAAIRLSVVGQFDGQRLIADLLPTIRDTTAMAITATRDDLGSATYGADLASMLHETQVTRLFRS